MKKLFVRHKIFTMLIIITILTAFAGVAFAVDKGDTTTTLKKTEGLIVAKASATETASITTNMKKDRIVAKIERDGDASLFASAGGMDMKKGLVAATSLGTKIPARLQAAFEASGTNDGKTMYKTMYAMTAAAAEPGLGYGAMMTTTLTIAAYEGITPGGQIGGAAIAATIVPAGDSTIIVA